MDQSSKLSVSVVKYHMVRIANCSIIQQICKIGLLIQLIIISHKIAIITLTTLYYEMDIHFT